MEILTPVLIVGIIGVLAGVMLTLAAKFMAVPVDERFTLLREALPGANCGACGFAGCDEYAQKLAANEDVALNLCTPGGGDTAAKLGDILGASAGVVVPMQAVVRCSGTEADAGYVMDYQGPQTCEGCNYFYQGDRTCSHACLGYGDCVEVCQYDAIHIIDGIAVVDPEACTGCSMCAKKCPNLLIQLMPKRNKVYIGCSSTDRGAFVRKVCSAGCIGCRKCEKVCPHGAIVVEDNLASILPEKCTSCGECIGVCPTGVIRTVAEPLQKGSAARKKGA